MCSSSSGKRSFSAAYKWLPSSALTHPGVLTFPDYKGSFRRVLRNNLASLRAKSNLRRFSSEVHVNCLNRIMLKLVCSHRRLHQLILWWCASGLAQHSYGISSERHFYENTLVAQTQLIAHITRLENGTGADGFLRLSAKSSASQTLCSR